MRFRLTFRASVTNTRIPLAYNSALSTQLASWLGVPASGVLRKEGPGADDCRAEQFVFSRLLIKSKLVDLKSATIKILSPVVSVYLGIPQGLAEPESIIAGLQGRELAMGTGGERFLVEKIEAMQTPVWSRKMNFRMLSPMAVQGPGGAWLQADAPDLSEIAHGLLLERHRCLYSGVELSDEEFTLLVDPQYLAQRGGGSGVAKHVHVKGADGADQEVAGFICPVTLRGNPRLIALAYDSGLGSMCMQGFGMIG